MNRCIAPFFLCVVLALSFIACSNPVVEQPVAEKHAMPDQYSRFAVETMAEVAAYFPSATSLAAFSSYGSVVETVQAVEQWDMVNRNDLRQALSDLGTHYLLDPSKLKSFYDAGFHTGKGWGIGLLGRHVVVVLQTLDAKKVTAWLDNLVTEEFGRPVVEDSKFDGWQFHTIHAMNKDVVTLMHKDGIAIMVWKGETLKASKELVRVVSEGQTLAAATDMDELKRNFRNASILALVPGKAALPGALIPEHVRHWVEDLTKSLTVGVNLDPQNANVRIATGLNPENAMVSELQKLEGGVLGPWANPIIHTDPAVCGRVKLDPKQLVSLLLKKAPSKIQNQWKDISSKLNNRLLGINFEQQVVNNLGGSVWFSLNAVRPETLKVGTPLLPMVLDQDVSLYIAMADAGLAAKFFGKMSFLKKFVPPDMAQIDTDQGILHAIIKLEGKNVHVSYADGLLAATTDSGWDRMKKLYVNPDQKELSARVLTDKANDLAIAGSSAPMMALVRGICGVRCADVTTIGRKAEQFDFRVMLDGNTLVSEIHLDRTQKNP